MSTDACSIAASLEVIGDRWTVLILRDVFRGVHRFTDLHSDLGIARNLLSDRLSRLVAHGILRKEAYCERPRRYEYRLTPKGADLSSALVALMQWGDRWYAPDGPPTVLYHAACGTGLVHESRCPRCHVAVTPGQIRGRPGPGRAPLREGGVGHADDPPAAPQPPAPPARAGADAPDTARRPRVHHR